MKHTLYWLWISLKKRLKPRFVKELYEQFGSIEAIFEAKDYNNVENLHITQLKELHDKSLEEAESVYKSCVDTGIQIVPYDHEDYPERLRYINDPPSVLYVRGRLSLNMNELAIGIVGTRDCSDYGIAATEYISTGLVQCGAAVISGMARGIDGAAAQAALAENGYTVAVLGCGVDVVYPPEHEELMKSIIERGAVVSEYPPGSPPSKTHFPIRNRIISGMSNGVVVVEAPVRSGALITARNAIDEGRDVFCVPGSIFSGTSAGSNAFINQGAKVVNNAADILSEYPAFDAKYAMRVEMHEAETVIPEPVQVEEPSGLSEDEHKVFELLSKQDMHIDTLIRETGINTSVMNTVIIMLEIRNIIEQKPGNVYGLVR